VVITALRDEEGRLRGFSKVTRDITERKRAEAKLQRSLDSLLALYEAGQVLGSTLEREQIGSELLGITQRVSALSAACIDLLDEDGQLCTLHSIGSEDLWRRVRSGPEAAAARREALETGEPRPFELQPSHANETPLTGLCLTLQVRDRVVGLLEAYGPEALAQKENVDTLVSLANQGTSALENARLYEELGERERELRDLVGRMLVAEEEERRRVAYEVHDGLTQMVVAAHQRLQLFAEDYQPGSAEGRRELEETIDLVRRTVTEARRVIADLRPTTLDDFGLATAVRLQVEELRARGYEMIYEETLGEERLPATLETALFRVVQEALTNARKHAGTERVRVTLGHRPGGRVRLEVRDWGRGFDPTGVARGNGPGERVGLSSMRERIALLGGHLEVSSEPGEGTSVVAEVPMPVIEGEDGHGG
jgi:signal transduction histidine kinase